MSASWRCCGYCKAKRQAKAKRVRKGDAAGSETVEIACNPDNPLLAHVFKVTTDPYVGKLAMLRILQGQAPSQGQARPQGRCGRKRNGGNRMQPRQSAAGACLQGDHRSLCRQVGDAADTARPSAKPRPSASARAMRPEAKRWKSHATPTIRCWRMSSR